MQSPCSFSIESVTQDIQTSVLTYGIVQWYAVSATSCLYEECGTENQSILKQKEHEHANKDSVCKPQLIRSILILWQCRLQLCNPPSQILYCFIFIHWAITHIHYVIVSVSGIASSCICPVKDTVTLGVTVEYHHLWQEWSKLITNILKSISHGPF